MNVLQTELLTRVQRNIEATKTSRTCVRTSPAPGVIDYHELSSYASLGKEVVDIQKKIMMPSSSPSSSVVTGLGASIISGEAQIPSQENFGTFSLPLDRFGIDALLGMAEGSCSIDPSSGREGADVDLSRRKSLEIPATGGWLETFWLQNPGIDPEFLKSVHEHLCPTAEHAGLVPNKLLVLQPGDFSEPYLEAPREGKKKKAVLGKPPPTPVEHFGFLALEIPIHYKCYNYSITDLQDLVASGGTGDLAPGVLKLSDGCAPACAVYRMEELLQHEAERHRKGKEKQREACCVSEKPVFADTEADTRDGDPFGGEFVFYPGHQGHDCLTMDKIGACVSGVDDDFLSTRVSFRSQRRQKSRFGARFQANPVAEEVEPDDFDAEGNVLPAKQRSAPSTGEQDCSKTTTTQEGNLPENPEKLKCRCAAWLCGTPMRIRPVRAGYRVIMIYNLMKSGTKVKTTGKDEDEGYCPGFTPAADLGGILSWLNTQDSLLHRLHMYLTGKQDSPSSSELQASSKYSLLFLLQGDYRCHHPLTESCLAGCDYRLFQAFLKEDATTRPKLTLIARLNSDCRKVEKTDSADALPYRGMSLYSNHEHLGGILSATLAIVLLNEEELGINVVTIPLCVPDRAREYSALLVEF